MREATGELNITLIVVMAIAALAAFFFIWVWPVYRENYMRDESCADAVCDIGYDSTGLAFCYTPGSPADLFTCPYRG